MRFYWTRKLSEVRKLPTITMRAFFSIATLLCSMLGCNSLGSVDEAAISNLCFVANLTQHTKVQSSSEATSGGSKKRARIKTKSFLASFMWVIRDFVLELVDEDGDPITHRNTWNVSYRANQDTTGPRWKEIEYVK